MAKKKAKRSARGKCPKGFKKVKAGACVSKRTKVRRKRK